MYERLKLNINQNSDDSVDLNQIISKCGILPAYQCEWLFIAITSAVNANGVVTVADADIVEVIVTIAVFVVSGY